MSQAIKHKTAERLWCDGSRHPHGEPSGPQHGENTMKQLLIILGLFGELFALGTTDANAVTCARGVYRAGCAGPNGAVAVRRPVVAPRAVVVAPRATVVRRGVVVRR